MQLISTLAVKSRPTYSNPPSEHHCFRVHHDPVNLVIFERYIAESGFAAHRE